MLSSALGIMSVGESYRASILSLFMSCSFEESMYMVVYLQSCRSLGNIADEYRAEFCIIRILEYSPLFIERGSLRSN